MTKQVSADEVFRVAKGDPNISLTKEQREAVELAPTDSPTLVVAGAGSGKTELMAVRVLWLVANGHAEPHEILGLTFTRKAASELSRRINNGLQKLAATDYWPLPTRAFASPNISTYNAYANALFHDHALALGFEPDALLLSESTRYQLAREVVLKYGADVDSRINESDSSLNSIVEAVLDLASQMIDNGVTADEINEFVQTWYEKLAALPAINKTEKDPIPKTRLGVWADFFRSGMIANLAQRFIEEKKIQGFFDYSDQVALAAKAAEIMPDQVGGLERTKYKHVLLDEYQDTSTLQTKLMRLLFAGHPVFAVGDPNQSIYGWRGASASNLREYVTEFGSEAAPVSQFSLQTSWRNPAEVLDLANLLLQELHQEPRFLTRDLDEAGLADLAKSKIKVLKLEPKQNAGKGDIELSYTPCQSDEAEAVAEWFERKFVAADGKEKPTAALLLRAKSSTSKFVAALSARHIPFEVVGVAGLLEMPEIVDLVSALKVVHNPTAGGSLLRLLAGPRWRIGAKDIQQLYLFAKSISGFDNEDDVELQGEEVGFSIVDALDELLDRRNIKTGISETGLYRMRDCAKLLRKLRYQTGLPLTEFVRVVEQELWLDIELTANPNRERPMAQLNAFANVVANYSAGAHPTLGGFLQWLEFAASKESFETPSVSATSGVVQILTVHGAKGLEWDLVAVPMLTEGTFPTSVGGNKGWVNGSGLPYQMRGDKDSLPKLEFPEGATNQKDLDNAYSVFSTQDVVEYRVREERRLAYVAVTRAKKALLVSASYFKAENIKPALPSRFLTEMSTLIAPLPDYSHITENPENSGELTMSWPMDPLGPAHRPKVVAAKELVEKAIDEPDTAKVDREIDLLIDDLADSVSRATQAKLPVRIPASRFKEFLHETAEVAELYRRPVPREPFSATMAGTLFHTWVEEHFGITGIKDELDISVTVEEESGNPAFNIEDLKETFLASRFESMQVADIECEIQVTINSNTFICKIDAVFHDPNGGYEIVDWKTGVAPKTEEEIAEKALQLALYRMAYSKFKGVSESDIKVCLYYVNENKEINPENVPSEKELIGLWNKVLETVSD